MKDLEEAREQILAENHLRIDGGYLLDDSQKLAHEIFGSVLERIFDIAISERAKNIELINALAECCRMFEWCDVRYGQLIRSPSPS